MMRWALTTLLLLALPAAAAAQYTPGLILALTPNTICLNHATQDTCLGRSAAGVLSLTVGARLVVPALTINGSAAQWTWDSLGGVTPGYFNGALNMNSNAIGNVSAVNPTPGGASDMGAGNNGFRRLYLDYTNTATVGSVTMHKASGRVNLAAAGTTLTVTNAFVTAASHIFLNADGAPGNLVAVLFFAVPASGSFTVNAVPAVTNQTAIDFLVVNAD